jgi:uncharacterized protein (TIGR00255 family)
MIRSMTAFADCEIVTENMTILCELRSVNHRYCDLNIRIPERLRFAENDIRKQLSEKLKRGKIECTLSYKKQLNVQNFSVDFQLVEKLLITTSKIETLMANPQPFSALDILAFPGVQHEIEADKDTLRETIVLLVKNTLDKMLENRSREGAQLVLLLTERCQKIMQLVEAAHKRMPEVLTNLRNKLISRVAELITDTNSERLELELALIAQKLDVDEELDRLETHVKEVIHTLKQAEPTGRRLDFLMQEMNREANTLGSKSADKEMTQISIDLKVLIEQMREQIQNIE